MPLVVAININYQKNEKEEEHFAIFAPFSQACGLVLTQASKQELHSLLLLISQSTKEFINELEVKRPYLYMTDSALKKGAKGRP